MKKSPDIPLKISRRTRPATVNSGQITRFGKWKRRFAIFSLILLSLGAVLACFVAWTVHDVSEHLPNVDSLADVRLKKATTIVSNDGIVLATLETRDQRPVSLADISPAVIEATLAIEDERFYSHNGVDYRGVLRALWSNVRLGNSRGQGGSTLTQQLARNLYLTNEKTYRRKIAEMLLAQRIEQKYSKQAILEAYLNSVYYGNGNYGIEAAAQNYFGKSAKTLTMGEAALLAGIPQRPLAYTPTLHLRAALERRKNVLERLNATGKITSALQTQAEAERPHILRPNTQSMKSWRAPYFVADVIAVLREKYGSEFVYSGVTVETTLNWQMQAVAERLLRTALRHGSNSTSNPNTGAIVCLDPRTGYVRALVGGPNFKNDQFDAATHGLRQPGSAFKPLMYAAAFDANICNLLSIYNDAPLTYPAGVKDYVVHDYDGGYKGPMNVLDAIRHSTNTVAVKVGEETGPANVSAYAKRLGILSPLDPTLALSLGASAVHPLDLCSVYTVFANGGDRYEPAFIIRITDAKDKVVFNDDQANRHIPGTFKKRAIEEINVALREVALNGTGVAAASIPDGHGKTGTTNSHRDAWFVGYTADLAVTVWMAHVHRSHKPSGQKSDNINSEITYLPMGSATGGELCAPLWTRFMQEALPVQNKVNAAHGILASLVPAPALKAMLDTLKFEASEAIRLKAAEKANGVAADGTPLPAGFQPAENGSGPITVNVPDDDSKDKISDKDKLPDSVPNAEDTPPSEPNSGGDVKEPKSGDGTLEKPAGKTNKPAK